jgi:hypothetical protein
MTKRSDPYYEPEKATDYEWVWLEKHFHTSTNGGQNAPFFLKGDETDESFEPVDWSGDEKFPINRGDNYEIGDNNLYLELRKIIWESGMGRTWEGYAWVTKDWEFEEYTDFKVPKRFIQMLERWKKFKEGI